MNNRHLVQNLGHLLQAAAGVETRLDAAVRQKTLQQLAAGLRRRRTAAPPAEASKRSRENVRAGGYTEYP